jgi:hypothetical protein
MKAVPNSCLYYYLLSGSEKCKTEEEYGLVRASACRMHGEGSHRTCTQVLYHTKDSQFPRALYVGQTSQHEKQTSELLVNAEFS